MNGFLSSRDGTHLFYEVSGKGPALLFCYGLVCRREHWRHQIAHLADRYQIITFDYRAHHRSEVPQNDTHMTLEWCANDAQDIIQYLDLKEVVCLGHSMGVPVGIRLAGLEPERIKGLILICGSVRNPFEGMFFTDRMNSFFKIYSSIYESAPTLLSHLWERFTEPNPISYFITSRLGFNANLAQKVDVLSYMEGVNQTPFPIFYSLIKDYTQINGMALLKQVQCPTISIAGEEDCITPLVRQQEMVQGLSKGRLFTVSGGSHNVHLDKPNEVNQIIDEFLSEIAYV